MSYCSSVSSDSSTVGVSLTLLGATAAAADLARANVPLATRTYGDDAPSRLIEELIWAFTVAAGVAPSLVRSPSAMIRLP